MAVFSPSHRLLCCTPLDCKREHWAIKTVAVCVCVCVHSSFSIPLIDYLVSWQNYFPFVAMASRKSISLMFWTYCTKTALKMFLLTDFDPGCFSVSTLELVSVVLCFFSPEKSWNSVVRTLRVWWSRGITWRKRSSDRKRQTTGEWLVFILCSHIGCFCFLQPLCIPLCLFCSAVWQCFVCEPSIGICVKSCRVRRSWRATSTPS